MSDEKKKIVLGYQRGEIADVDRQIAELLPGMTRTAAFKEAIKVFLWLRGAVGDGAQVKLHWPDGTIERMGP